MLDKPLIFLIAGVDDESKKELVRQLNKIAKKKGLDVLEKRFAEMAEDIAMNHTTWNGEWDKKGQILLQKITAAITEHDPRAAVNFLLDVNLEECQSDNTVILVDDWQKKLEAETVSEDETLQLVKILVATPLKINAGDLPAANSGYYDFVVARGEQPQTITAITQKFFS